MRSRPTTWRRSAANFDGISYAKGAAVLRQLSAYVGEESFTAGLRALPRPALIRQRSPGEPRCEFSTDAVGRFTEFAVVQEAPELHSVLRPHQVTIGLYQRSGDALTRAGGAEADVTGARTEVPSLVGTVRPDLILLNDDDTG